MFDLYFKGNFPNSYLTDYTISLYGLAVHESQSWYRHEDNFKIREYCDFDVVGCFVNLGDKVYFVSELYLNGEIFSYFVSWDDINNIDFFGFFSICENGKLCSIDFLFFYLFAFTLLISIAQNYVLILISERGKLRLDKLSGLKRRDSFKTNKLDNRVKAFFLDIDHFKNINDTYGHDVGDEAIKAFANCLKENIRDKDVAFRWGGEEFLVILRGKVDDNIDVYYILERLRASVEAMDIDGVPKFTVSTGYCVYDANVDAKELIKQADVALYESKRTGRNKVSQYKNSMSDK